MTEEKLRYIETLRGQVTLAEAIPGLRSLAEALPEKRQLSLEVDSSVSAAEERLLKSAKRAAVSSNEEANRWSDFIIIAEFHGLAAVVDWLLRNCSALLVPSNVEEIERCYAR